MGKEGVRMNTRSNPSLTNPGTVICEANTLTPPQAIQRARQMMSDHHDVAYSPQAYRDIIAGLMAAMERSPTFVKAMERGQEVFVLVQQDKLAPALLHRWALGAAQHGCKWRKAFDAMQLGLRWKFFPGA